MIVIKRIGIIGLFIPLLFSSCIQEEELDTNADILETYIPTHYLRTDPIITNISVED